MSENVKENPKPRKVVGERLGDLLKEKDVQQRELAYGTNLSEITISNVKNGKRKMSRKTAKLIADYFDKERPEWIPVPYTEKLVHFKDLSDVDRVKANRGDLKRAYDKELFPGEEYDVFAIEQILKQKVFLNPEYLLGESDEKYLTEIQVSSDGMEEPEVSVVFRNAVCNILRFYGFDIQYSAMPYTLLPEPDFDSEISQEMENSEWAKVVLRTRDKKVELTPSELHCLFKRYLSAMKTITEDLIYEKEVASHFNRK